MGKIKRIFSDLCDRFGVKKVIAFLAIVAVLIVAIIILLLALAFGGNDDSPTQVTTATDNSSVVGVGSTDDVSQITTATTITTTTTKPTTTTTTTTTTTASTTTTTASTTTRAGTTTTKSPSSSSTTTTTKPSGSLKPLSSNIAMKISTDAELTKFFEYVYDNAPSTITVGMLSKYNSRASEIFDYKFVGQMDKSWYDRADGYIEITFNFSYIDSYLVRRAYLAGSSSGLNSQQKELYNKVSSIISNNIKSSDSTYQKAKILNDYVISSVAYDYDSWLKGSIPDISYTAYGALVKGKAVCGGYVDAYKLLALCAGIECRTISGDSLNESGTRGAHAWNVIKLSDGWYFVDTTWDDPTPDKGASGNNRKYFCMSYKKFVAGHFANSTLNPTNWGTQYLS